MRIIRANKLLLVAVAVGMFCLAATFAVRTDTKGPRCKSSPCTYIDAQGRASNGTCGSKKGDDKNCYCFENEDKKLSQKQSGCSKT